MTLVAYAYQSTQKKALEERTKESPWRSGMCEHLKLNVDSNIRFFALEYYSTNAFKVGFPDKYYCKVVA